MKLKKRYRNVPTWVWILLIIFTIFLSIYAICIINTPETTTQITTTPESPQFMPICGNQICEKGESISCPQDCGEPKHSLEG